MAWQLWFSQNLTNNVIGLNGLKFVSKNASPRWPGWLRSLDRGLLQSPQLESVGAIEEGQPLTSIQCDCIIIAAGMCNGKDLFILRAMLDVRLTESLVLAGSPSATLLVGTDSNEDPTMLDDEGCAFSKDEDGFETLAGTASEELLELTIPRLSNICTCMHIFLALCCLALAKNVLQSLEQQRTLSFFTWT